MKTEWKTKVDLETFKRPSLLKQYCHVLTV